MSNMKTRLVLSMIALLIVLVNGQKIDTPIPCGQTSDCTDITTLPRNAFCKQGYCMCPNEAKNCSSLSASVHEMRAPGPLVYRRCKLDQDCIFKGGFCNIVKKQCDCLMGYISSANGQHCVPVLNFIDANCIDKNQCLSILANSTCHDNKCVCTEDYYYENNTCWRKVDYGHSCTRNEDCSYIEGVICTNDRKCECEAETVLNSDHTKCLTVAKKIRDKCVDMVQCTTTFEHSACIDNICQCKPNYHYENDVTRCFPNKALDEDCANDYDCYQTEYYTNDSSIKPLKCEANKCTCADNYFKNNEECVNSGSSLAASLSMIFSAMALVCSILFS